MSYEVPCEVTSFAHALAAHYRNPVVRILEHVPQKGEPVLRERTCSNKEIKQDDDLKKNHLASAVSGNQALICDRPNAAVLLCIPLLDQIRDAESFFASIKQELEYSSLAILCARDRERTPRSSGQSEEADWTPSELKNRLARWGIPVLFIGHTRVTEADTSRSIIVAVLAGQETPSAAPAPADFRVIAIMSSFNEADIIGPSLDYLLQQGVRVHLLENWSTDGTYDIAAVREARGVHIERFPPEGRSDHYHIGPILRRKEELAKELEADWFIHADVDEIREGPFPGGHIREALHHAGRGGFSCVESTHLEFPPVDESFQPGGDFRSHFRFWKPISRLGQREFQRKIWKKTSASVNLAGSGGHDVSFPGRRMYPFHFLLRHYPFRSSRQASRKLFQDRNLNPDEYQVTRWGKHYYELQKNPGPVQRPEDLRHFSSSFYDDYLIERLSAIGFGPPSNENGAGKVKS